jgi:hypothetical protein
VYFCPALLAREPDAQGGERNGNLIRGRKWWKEKEMGEGE